MNSEARLDIEDAILCPPTTWAARLPALDVLELEQERDDNRKFYNEQENNQIRTRPAEEEEECD